MTPLTRDPFVAWDAAYDRAKAKCETAAWMLVAPDWSEIDPAGVLNATERYEINRSAVARIASARS